MSTSNVTKTCTKLWQPTGNGSDIIYSPFSVLTDDPVDLLPWIDRTDCRDIIRDYLIPCITIIFK